MGQSPKQTPSEDQKTEEAQTVKARTTLEWPSSRWPTQCLKGTGKCHLTTVPHLTEGAYFLWNTGCRLWQDMPDISWEDDRSPLEWDMDPERKQSGWKQDSCENCSLKACLVHHSAQSKAMTSRLWNYPHGGFTVQNCPNQHGLFLSSCM